MENEIIKELKELPNLIQEKEIHILKDNNKISEIKLRLEITENEVYKEITSEKTEEGKAIFSNEQSRKAELSIRLNSNKYYQDKVKQHRDLIDDINKNKIVLNFLNNKFSSLKYIVRILGDKNE